MSIQAIGRNTDYKATVSWDGVKSRRDAIACFKDDDSFVIIGIPLNFVADISFDFNVFGIYTEQVSNSRKSWEILFTKEAQATLNVRHTDYGGINFKTGKNDVLFIAEYWEPKDPDDDWNTRVIIQAGDQNYHSSVNDHEIGAMRSSDIMLYKGYLKQKLKAILYDANHGIIENKVISEMGQQIPEICLAKHYVGRDERSLFWVDENSKLGHNSVGFYDGSDYWTDLSLARITLPGKLNELIEQYGLNVYGCFSYSAFDKYKVLSIGVYTRPKIVFEVGKEQEAYIGPKAGNKYRICEIILSEANVDVYKRTTTARVCSAGGAVALECKHGASFNDMESYVIPDEIIDAAYAEIKKYTDPLD